MAITLIKYPVVVESGRVNNIFAGFQPVELEFERKDTNIISVTNGADNKVLISIVGDITSNLNVGEWVYLYAEGSTFIYDGSFQILDLNFATNTEITVDSDYIENATTGYCNYKQNWFLESKLVDKTNTDVKKYPKLLQSDGSPSGEVKVNTSMLVDFLTNSINSTSQEITEGRNECKVMYREVWREDDTATFILVDNEPIIIIFAAENSEIETFVNEFEVPRMWEGYPMLVNLLHSRLNYDGERVSIKFDQLDINKKDISTGQLLANFSPQSFGLLQTNFADNENTLDNNTRYIRINAETSGLGDFETVDFNDNDFFTINTP